MGFHQRGSLHNCIIECRQMKLGDYLVKLKKKPKRKRLRI